MRANDGALLSPGSRVEVEVLRAGGSQLQAGGCSTSRRTPARSTSASLAIGGAVLGLLVHGLLARRRLRTSPRR